MKMMQDNNHKASDLSGDGKKRRKTLLGISTALGGIGSVAVAAPFVGSFRPSRKTQAAGAPIVVSLAEMAEGDLQVSLWRQKPVWVLRRSSAMLALLDNESDLLDPQSNDSGQPPYCKNKNRSIKPEYFVAVGLCTHLGCLPREDGGDGFLCACHGSRFDFAGRVLKGSPAPKNLFIPPHHYDDNGNVVIGSDVPSTA